MGIWYDLFHRGLIKRYDHIASLGYNCEIAYQLFKHNRFLESNLFAWSYIPSLDRLIEVLGDVSMIGRDGYAVTGHALYNDKTTGIGFHGRAKPSEVADNPAAVAEDVRELTGRVAFLKDKFIKTARDEGRKLYAIKIKSGEPDVFAKLERLRGRLTALTGGGVRPSCGDGGGIRRRAASDGRGGRLLPDGSVFLAGQRGDGTAQKLQGVAADIRRVPAASQDETNETLQV